MKNRRPASVPPSHRSLRTLSVSDGHQFVEPGIVVGSIVQYRDHKRGDVLAIVRGTDERGRIALTLIGLPASKAQTVALWSESKRRGYCSPREGWQR